MDQKDVKNPESAPNRRTVYIITTIAIYFGNITLGSSTTALAPLVSDFAKKYETEIDQISVIFTMVTIFYVIGALLTGFAYNYVRRQLGVVVALAGTAIGLYIVPHCPDLISLYAVAAVLGLFIGIYDASQVVWVMEMWQGASGPFIQGQHFFFAVGGLIPGFLMAPFLTDVSATDTETQTSSAELWIPFTSLAIYATLASTFQLYLYIFKPYYPPPREDRAVGDDQWEQKSSTFSRLKLVIFMIIFVGFYQGMDLSTGQFISNFGQYGEHSFSESDGSLLFTAMMSAYTVGRAFGIVTILKIPPQFILIFNLFTILVACIILLFSNQALWVLWVGAGVLGLGFSTTYPSFCAYIERHVEVTNVIGSLMLVCGSLISSVYPLVLGFQIQNNPFILIYLNLFTLATITITLVIIFILTTSGWKIIKCK